jgi:hypothetical protein
VFKLQNYGKWRVSSGCFSSSAVVVSQFCGGKRLPPLLSRQCFGDCGSCGPDCHGSEGLEWKGVPSYKGLAARTLSSSRVVGHLQGGGTRDLLL